VRGSTSSKYGIVHRHSDKHALMNCVPLVLPKRVEHKVAKKTC
jgi:hypothetical protein